MPLVFRPLFCGSRRPGQDLRKRSRPRKENKKHASAVGIVFHPDGPAVRLHDGSANGKAQAQALTKCLVPALDLMECVEDPLFVGVFNAGTGIGNGDQGKTVDAVLVADP